MLQPVSGIHYYFKYGQPKDQLDHKLIDKPVYEYDYQFQ